MSSASPEFDEEMLRRAIRLAMNGRGHVEPNPMVGCVIVKDGRVIGEGFHARYGEAHAEPAALANCTESPEDATAYVTLEPCCHTNKKTPPCAPQLIEAKFARVVIGTLDPNPNVNGKGVAMLREAGIEVTTSVLEAEAKQLIAPFIARTLHRRPYVTLKWAETADGKVAGPGGKRLQITNAESSRLVHQLRARSEVIVVGIGTVLKDDPVLTARDVGPSRQMARVVLDSHARTPPDSRLVRDSDGPWVDIFMISDDYEALERSVSLSKFKHVTVTPFSAGTVGIPLRDVIEHAATLTATHLLVEPGPTLARSFLNERLVDRIWRFQSQTHVNDDSAPSAAEIPTDYRISRHVSIGTDVLTEYLNPSSAVFFSASPSADLMDR